MACVSSVKVDEERTNKANETSANSRKVNSEDSKIRLQKAFELLGVNTESAPKKCCDTLLQAAEYMRRTVLSGTGTARDTNR